jgi:hypothetical protein
VTLEERRQLAVWEQTRRQNLHRLRSERSSLPRTSRPEVSFLRVQIREMRAGGATLAEIASKTARHHTTVMYHPRAGQSRVETSRVVAAKVMGQIIGELGYSPRRGEWWPVWERMLRWKGEDGRPLSIVAIGRVTGHSHATLCQAMKDRGFTR